MEELAIPGVVLARPARHEDDRGWFMEIMREEAFRDVFVQANHSRSKQGVLRGLHYHREQADAWYVLSGVARVGLADLRRPHKGIATLTVELRGDEPAVLYLPPGVAHGFYAVTDLDLIYFVTRYYDSSDEHSVAWDDPALGVPWGVEEPILSERDRTAPPLDPAEVERVLRAGG